MKKTRAFVPAVRCMAHGVVPLLDHEYSRQLDRPDDLWTCPRCGEVAAWAGNE